MIVVSSRPNVRARDAERRESRPVGASAYRISRIVDAQTLIDSFCPFVGFRFCVDEFLHVAIVIANIKAYLRRRVLFLKICGDFAEGFLLLFKLFLVVVAKYVMKGSMVDVAFDGD